MRLSSRLAAALLIVGFAPLPALAAEIGIRSRGGGTPPISDGSWFRMGACYTAFDTGDGIINLDQDLANAGYSCAYYSFPSIPSEGQDDLYSWMLAFTAGGRYLQGFLESGFSDGSYILSNQTFESEFGTYPVALFELPDLGTISCFSTNTTCDITVFLRDGLGPFHVSSIAFGINTFDRTVNSNLRAPSPIPAPGALALLATGLAGALWRRKGGRRT